VLLINLMNFMYLKLSFSCSVIISHLREVHRTQDSSFSGYSEVLRDVWGRENSKCSCSILGFRERGS